MGDPLEHLLPAGRNDIVSKHLKVGNTIGAILLVGLEIFRKGGNIVWKGVMSSGWPYMV